MSQFLFAANCSQAQEFYSLIVLNVPCWLSQGLLQRLDPRAVWVYGLRYRRGGTPRYAKPSYFFQVFSSSSRGFSSLCTAGVLLLIFMCLNIFNHDLYKLKRSPHFLLSLQTDIESHSPAWGFILSFQVWTLHRLLKAVGKCLLCLVGQHKKTELK